jgi:peptide subunit release factor 1 (eRF1)
MPSYECSECGATAVERPYEVMAVEVACPECGEFCPHVDMDHHRVQHIMEALEVDGSAAEVVAAVRGRL